MSLDQNLMGLGLPAPLAERIATGGTGNGTGGISVTAKGTSVATAYQIGGKQFVTYVSAAGTSGANAWVTLPNPGQTPADNAPEIADDFVVHNGLSTATNVTVGIPSGVTLNVGGAQYTNSTPFTLAQWKTLTYWVQSTTQLFGLSS